MITVGNHFQICGGGDALLAQAAIGYRHFVSFRELSEAQQMHYSAWADSIHRKVNGKIGATEGTALHLWHGNRSQRGYNERTAVLREGEFDPSVDLQLNEHGLWRCATHKLRMHAAVKAYFGSRKEDKSIPDAQIRATNSGFQQHSPGQLLRFDSACKPGLTGKMNRFT